MGRDSNVKISKGGFALILIGLVACSALVAFYWDDILTGIGLSQDLDTTEEETDFRFSALDSATKKALIDARFQIYRLNIEGLTYEQILDVDEYSNYVYLEAVASVYEDPDQTKYKYMVNSSLSGYDNFTFMPQLGLNTIYLLNQSESIASGAMSVNAMNSTFSSTAMTFDPATNTTTNTTSYTNDREWRMFLQTLDATSNATSLEGRRALYNWTDDNTDYIVLKITTNATTALSKWVSTYDGVSASKIVASGSDIYLCYNTVVLGLWETDIRFSVGLGVDFEAVSYDWVYGDESDNYAL